MFTGIYLTLNWLSNLSLPWLWFALMLLALLVEAMTVSLVSIWLAVGALAAMVAAFYNLAFPWQLFIMLAVSLVTFIASFKYKPLRRLLEPRKIATNSDELLAKEAIVTATVADANTALNGQVKYKGQLWSARSADGVRHDVGSIVKIKEIKGVYLYVVGLDK